MIAKNDSFYVAGHTGMVGSAIIRALKKNNYCNPSLGGSLLTEKRETLNLEDFDSVLKWFKKNKPNPNCKNAAMTTGTVTIAAPTKGIITDRPTTTPNKAE